MSRAMPNPASKVCLRSPVYCVDVNVLNSIVRDSLKGETVGVDVGVEVGAVVGAAVGDGRQVVLELAAVVLE